MGRITWSGELKEKRNGLREWSIKRFFNNFEMEGLMAQKGLWNLAQEKIMRELPNEEGDAVRES